VIAFIFARGGSKGLPDKNLRMLAGVPLIGHAIQCAMASGCIDRVIVSTDSQRIADVAVSSGAEVPFLRPPELAADDSPELLSWQHAVREVQARDDTGAFDIFVSVPTTAPLRVPSDVSAVIDRLEAGGVDLVMTVTPSHRNPWFNMARHDTDGRLSLLLESSTAYTRRQDVPEVFDLTTVAYAARPDFILNAASLWDGPVGSVTVPRKRALDIDTEDDLRHAEFLLQERALQAA
jgi:N-acylneuraminate cytidylyltransferase